MTTQQTEIQNRFLKGVTLKLFVGILLCTISVTGSIVTGFWSLKSDVRDLKTEISNVRQEVKVALDTVKYRQQIRAIETDAKFQRIDDKLNAIQNNTNNKK